MAFTNTDVCETCFDCTATECTECWLCVYCAQDLGGDSEICADYKKILKRSVQSKYLFSRLTPNTNNNKDLGNCAACDEAACADYTSGCQTCAVCTGDPTDGGGTLCPCTVPFGTDENGQPDGSSIQSCLGPQCSACAGCEWCTFCYGGKPTDGGVYPPPTGTGGGGGYIPPSDSGCPNIPPVLGNNRACNGPVSVSAWGWNFYNQCVIPKTIDSSVVKISAGAFHNLALTNTGKVIAWGRNTEGQCSVPANLPVVSDIAAGGYGNLVLSQGKVIYWGAEDDQTLYGTNISNIPTELTTGGVTAISISSSHALALKNGKVYIWGQRQLINGKYEVYDPAYGVLNIPEEALSGVIAIFASGRFSLALKSDGRIIGWGSNFQNQLGTVEETVWVSPDNGYRENIKSSVWGDYWVKNLGSGVTAVSAGGWHSCALQNGKIVCWGKGTAAAEINDPTDDVVAIACATWHTHALRRSGKVVSWGGFCGGADCCIVDTTKCQTPTYAESGVTAISAGAFHNLIIGPCTLTPPIPCPLPPVCASGFTATVISVDACGCKVYECQGVDTGESGDGDLHVNAIETLGSRDLNFLSQVSGFRATVYNQYIILSQVPATSSVAASQIYVDNADNYILLNLKDFIDAEDLLWIDLAKTYTDATVLQLYSVVIEPNLTLLQTRIAAALSLYYRNQTGEWQDKLLQRVVSGTAEMLPSQSVGVYRNTNELELPVSIALKGKSALVTNNAAVSWGVPLSDSLANFGQTVVPEEALSNISQVAISSWNTMAIKNGKVLVWGKNNRQQLTVPTEALSNAIGVAGTYNILSALISDERNGSVVTWGIPVEANESILLLVPLAAESNVASICAGSQHFCALKTDGTVVCWGRNYEGQCAGKDAAGVAITSPTFEGLSQVVIGGNVLGNVRKISAGQSHTLALLHDGSVVSWGSNTLGEGTVPTAALSGVIDIATGGYHNIALKSDGTVVCWGQNRYGQCLGYNGQGGRNDTPAIATGNTPPQILGLSLGSGSGVVSVAATTESSIALKSDGSIVVWGGQFDENNYTGVPANLLTPSSVSKLHTGSGGIHYAVVSGNGFSVGSDAGTALLVGSSLSDICKDFDPVAYVSSNSVTQSYARSVWSVPEASTETVTLTSVVPVDWYYRVVSTNMELQSWKEILK